MSTTLTINCSQLLGGMLPGSYVRIDLENCSRPIVIGSGQIVPKTVYVKPVNGVATVTLFDNTQINCGPINVHSDCGCLSGNNLVSYYSFNYIYQGEVTSVGSYRLRPGTFNLWDLPPCIGKDCICDDGTQSIPVRSQTPFGVVDGVNKVFTLLTAPTILWLQQNGVYQTEGIDYSLVGNIITFFFAPVGALYAVYTCGSCNPNITSEIPAGTIDGTNTVFTTTGYPSSKAIWLYVNGLYQTIGIDFTLNGNVITFTNPPTVGAKLFVDYATAGQTDNAFTSISTQTPTGVIDGANTHFSLSTSPKFLMLNYNSALLVPGVGYTQVGSNLTLAQAPQPGDILSATLFS